jgi:hypothetical protein
MKFSSLSLVLVAAVTLTVGCAKKPQAPGAAPVVNETTPVKDGVQPTGSNEKIVEKQNESGQGPTASVSALDGGWESNCVADTYNHQGKEYGSYRYYITISKGWLFEQLYYFPGNSCASYDDSIELGYGDLWVFDMIQEGTVNGAPFQVDYTYYNFESTGGFPGVIALKDEAGKKSIVFDDSALVFTRDN